MIKTVLFDLDGVVIEPGKEYFSTWYAREYGVPSEALTSFFKDTYRKCQLGQLDLKEELAKHLKDWKWPGSVDEFLKLWFERHDKPWTRLIEIVKLLKQRGIKSYIVSNQEKYRAEYLWGKLKEDFDGGLFSYEIGARKNQPEFWQAVLAKLGNPDPQTIDYWDDDQENIEEAQKWGIQGKMFEDAGQLGGY